MDLVEVLSFLFMLSTMELGREYSTEGMNDTQTAAMTQKAMLNDLRDYGFLWQRKPSSRRFYPTRLATTLTSSPPPLPTSTGSSSGPKEGFIVLETNYRIYAYTGTTSVLLSFALQPTLTKFAQYNPLQTAVLNLFVALKYRFPNLVARSITRDSVKKALSNGISAEQLSNNSCTPTNEKEQSLVSRHIPRSDPVMGAEKNRLKSQEGYLHTAFTSPDDYELVLNYTKQLDVLMWENAAKRYFFGSLDGHANIKDFIERRTGGKA
ncbi:transcription factor Tfb2-domain-containing protein [Mycena vulgaris]|nr:transcription factor Tfb2-domain-containing protein [Mycena vulgaris]